MILVNHQTTAHSRQFPGMRIKHVQRQISRPDCVLLMPCCSFASRYNHMDHDRFAVIRRGSVVSVLLACSVGDHGEEFAAVAKLKRARELSALR